MPVNIVDNVQVEALEENEEILLSVDAFAKEPDKLTGLAMAAITHLARMDEPRRLRIIREHLLKRMDEVDLVSAYRRKGA